jgi:hypothetical protein
MPYCHLPKLLLKKFRFFTADKAVGAKGFKAVWTEIKEGPGCKEFLCRASSFCISKNLKCNGFNNCGQDDKSDESDCEFFLKRY